MAKKEASDLHLKPMRPPLLRVKGKLIPINTEALQPKDLEEMLSRDPLARPEARSSSRTSPSTSGYGVTGVARFRANIFVQRGLHRGRLPADPLQDPGDRRARACPKSSRPSSTSRRARPHHRPDGLGQVARRSPRSCARSSRSGRFTSSRSRTRSNTSSPTARPPSRSARSEPTRPAFSEALKNMMRQDPDVIMVGEMRDWQTIQTVITAAETGPPRLLDAAHQQRGASRSTGSSTRAPPGSSSSCGPSSRSSCARSSRCA